MIMWILQVFVLMKAATLWNQVRHDAESKKKHDHGLSLLQLSRIQSQ